MSKKEIFILHPDGPMVRAALCKNCNQYYLPSIPICHQCQTETTEQLFSEGKVHSYTTVHTPAVGYVSPYTIGYIDLNDKVRILGHIELDKELNLDDKVTLTSDRNNTFIFKTIKK